MAKTIVYGIILNAATPWKYVENGKVIFEKIGKTASIFDASCDEFGSYQIILEEGDYEVTARGEGMIEQKRPWHLKIPKDFDPQNWAGTEHYVNFALLKEDPEDLTFAWEIGRIVDQNGNPIGGAKITWSNIDLSTFTTSWVIPGHRGKYVKTLIAGIYTRTVEMAGCTTRVDHGEVRNDGQIYSIGDLEIQC